MRFSGLSPDGSLVEMIELPDHPYFVGVPVPSGAQVPPDAPASALRRLRRGGRRARKHACSRVRARRRRRARAAREGDRGRRPFAPDALFLIAGPCVVEGDDLNLRVADHLARLAPTHPGRHHLQGELRQGESLERRRARAAPASTKASRARSRARSSRGFPCSPTCISPITVRSRPRWSTCCRSRRSCAGRPTCSSPRARRASR